MNQPRAAASAAGQAYRGEQLGLPESGPGSIAGFGARLGAFVVDALASMLVAGLFTQARGGDIAGRMPGTWSLLPLAIDYVLGILLAGRTLGMNLFGLRVIRVDSNQAVNPLQAAARTALLFLLLPALMWDRDLRGLQDRLTKTAVVRG